MDFIFQGFQSSLPVWVYTLIFVCTFLLSWWSYNISGIRSIYRYLLIALRSSVFFILILLLINPFLKSNTIYYESPEILVMMDNSTSTQIEKKEYHGIESYKSALDQLNFSDSSAIGFDFYSFSDEVTPSHFDSLSYDGEQTNLSVAVDIINANPNDAVAAILLSDGIYTSGRNPLYTSGNLDIPVFTIGLGDTTFQEDLLVSSVSTNATGYLNSMQTVTTTVQSNGFEGSSFSVELRKNSEVISSETVSPQTSKSTQEIEFKLSLEEEGLQQFEIVIPPLQNEWTDENNNQRFSIDVRDARQKILSLALEVHPDVRFIRSLLLEDQNIELTNRTWLGRDQFIEGPLVAHPDSVDLAIIHGYPQSGLSESLRQKVASLIEEVPVVITATPQFDAQEFDQQMLSLPLSVFGSWDYQPITLQMEAEYASHPIMELPSITYDQLPNLSAPIENLEPSPSSVALFSSAFQGNNTDTPVVTVQEIGNRRIAAITAYNWFRMNQNSNSEIRDFSQQLWYNIISWTSTDPDNQLLDIKPRKTAFSGSENVIINAYLKNERGEDETEGRIDVTLSSDSLDQRTYSMDNMGGGEYELDLGTLPEDIYSFDAMAQKDGRKLDQKRGEFSVAASNIEFLDVNRNDRLLRQIAQSSGGSYVPFDSLGGFWGQLEERELLEQQEHQETTFFYLHQHLWWFIVVILLLCGEWMLRKYLSLP